MSLDPRLARTAAAARRREAAIVAALGVGPLAVLAVAAWRLGGAPSAALALGIGLAAAGVFAWRRVARLSPRELARRLDRRADMEDSADLLFQPPERPSGLQALQQQRLRQRLSEGPAPDLRTPWPAKAIALAGALSLAAAAALLLAPAARIAAPPAPGETATREDSPATHTTLAEAILAVQPPGYTGLPARESAELSDKVPTGSQLRWRLRLSPQPAAVDLVFHDGEGLALRREGEHWVGERRLARSALYRIVPRDALPMADDRLHRLDAIPDQPPQLVVVAPDRTLSLRAEGQRDWTLSFEASDDYGLGDASLVITHAQGSGEQVTVAERRVALRGEGDPRARRYRRTLDLGALGLAEGDDLIVRLEVRDNRAPDPQLRRSPSYILRWPMPPATESTGMEGLVKKTLPAYFRSQRQIILDAEALVAQRPSLAAGTFVDRSDGIGVDQRILRMRYGQFLGEENVGGPEAPPGDGEEHHADDGHDHGAEPPADFGGAVDVLEEYGHTHDDAEAATLLDPETRALLKQALDAMWSSEGELRQGQPERALPHAYRALGFIKQVQQASRIYLARVGLELPPIDEGRRMGGERKGLGDRRDGLVAADPGDRPALVLWQALAPGADADAAAADFAAWLADNESSLADPLDLVAALEEVRADPACGACRERLRARLWPLLPTPAAAVPARGKPDAAGQAYLDALAAEAQP